MTATTAFPSAGGGGTADGCGHSFADQVGRLEGPGGSVLDLLLGLAANDGRGVCVACLRADTTPAGVVRPPRSDGQVLTAAGAAACALLLAEADGRRLNERAGSARRVRMAARVTGALLPPTRIDTAGRFAPCDASGQERPGALFELLLAAAVADLRGHLAEHDTSAWVDPARVAGTVADIHDIALHLQLS